MIEKITIKGGMTAIDNHLPDRQAAYGQATAKQRKTLPNKLRQGEIVQGKILKVMADKMALVQLPVGTVTARLHSRLKSGDTLFLLVKNTHPSLLLQVHAVSVSTGGKELEIGEILRMLDLPDNFVYVALVRFFKTRRSTITKDDILLMINSLSKLSKEDATGHDIPQLLKAISFMLESEIEINHHNFSLLKPVLLSSDEFLDNISLLWLERNKLEVPASEYMEKFIENLKDMPISSVLLKYLNFVKSGFDSASFHRELLLLIKMLKANGSGGRLTEKLNELLRSQIDFNNTAVERYGPMIFSFPVHVNGKLLVGQAIIRRDKQKTASEKQVMHFSFLAEDDDEGRIIIKCMMIGKRLTAQIFVRSKEMLDALKSGHNMLINSIKKAGFLPESVQYFDNNDPDISAVADLSSPMRNKLSVVI